MYRYTLCLIRKNDQWLLLNRQKQPAMGMWNGVGGKIEAGESPAESVTRETFEETGLTVTGCPVCRDDPLTGRGDGRDLFVPCRTSA